VGRLLDFYRPTLESMRPISLHEVIDHVLGLAAPQLQQSNITVIREWDAHLARVMGVSGHLKQVFLSLVLNAIDAMPCGGQLTIRTFMRGDQPTQPMAVVEFADTGSGIPSSELPKIFEPFYTTRTDRTGLGLAISYSIVEKHRGLLSASSSRSGAIFSVVLPAL